jgi:hypothetical protein
MRDWVLIDMLQGKKSLRRETYTRSMRPIKVVAEFDLAERAPLLVKVGISGVSSAGALRNLEEELPHWDFERVRTAAKKKWEEELGRIEIEADERTKRVFYSALYHTFLAPVLYEDVDGQYRGVDYNFYQSEGTNYTVFSLWDEASISFTGSCRITPAMWGSSPWPMNLPFISRIFTITSGSPGKRRRESNRSSTCGSEMI